MKPPILKKLPKIPTILPGIEIGVPLIITQNIFTNLHYDYDITNFKYILYQFSFGYFAYGTDRFLDSLEPRLDILSDKKKELYDFYDSNRLSIFISLFFVYTFLLYTFNCNETTKPLEYLLTSTILYKPFKQKFGQFKAFYIAICWTMATCIIPCVINDNNWNILYHPIDYLPCFFGIFSGSNIIDMEDIQEDKINGINTLPVLYGNKNVYLFIIFTIMFANVIFAANPNFSHRIIPNSMYELQNTGTLLIPFLKNYTEF